MIVLDVMPRVVFVVTPRDVIGLTVTALLLLVVLGAFALDAFDRWWRK